ncbi:MAG: GFA family protein [Steroidobacteraceae bacterium]
MLGGSCLCGKVRYEISGPMLNMYYCHCRMCRKASGSSFATNMQVHAEDFAIVAGRDSVKAYRSSPDELRNFCGNCGSPIYSEAEHRRGILSIRCGLLNGDPTIRPAHHIYAAYKAPWLVIGDGLPEFPEGPP